MARRIVAVSLSTGSGVPPGLGLMEMAQPWVELVGSVPCEARARLALVGLNDLWTEAGSDAPVSLGLLAALHATGCQTLQAAVRERVLSDVCLEAVVLERLMLSSIALRNAVGLDTWSRAYPIHRLKRWLSGGSSAPDWVPYLTWRGADTESGGARLAACLMDLGANKEDVFHALAISDQRDVLLALFREHPFGTPFGNADACTVSMEAWKHGRYRLIEELQGCAGWSSHQDRKWGKWVARALWEWESEEQKSLDRSFGGSSPERSAMVRLVQQVGNDPLNPHHGAIRATMARLGKSWCPELWSPLDPVQTGAAEIAVLLWSPKIPGAREVVSVWLSRADAKESLSDTLAALLAAVRQLVGTDLNGVSVRKSVAEFLDPVSWTLVWELGHEGVLPESTVQQALDLLPEVARTHMVAARLNWALRVPSPTRARVRL